MKHRPSLRPSVRQAVVGALAALAVGAGTLAVPTTATSTPEARAFAPQLVTVEAPSRLDRLRLQKIGLDLTEHAGHDYVEVVLHTAAERALLRATGLEYEVRIPDLARRLAEINRLNREFALANPRTKLPSGRNAYRTLADYDSEVQQLAKRRPGVAKAFTLPHRTVEGRKVWALEVAGDVRRTDDGRPTFVLMGLHHAREWPSGENTMEFAHTLVKGYGSNPRITRLLDRARVVLVPVVNPDGFDLSRTDGGLIDLNQLPLDQDPTGLGGTAVILGTPGQAYKRKNCRVVDGQPTPAGLCRATAASPGGYGVGVDLNRNYGGFWGGPGAAGPIGEGLDPSDPLAVIGQASPIYRGPAPFSEPETQNIRELVGSRQTTMLISNHTFGNLILRPNGVNPDTLDSKGIPVGDSPDEEGLKRLGAKMAAANGYTNQHGWELYDTTGTTEDWSYNATAGYGYTFEIGPDEFHPPFEDVVGQYLGTGRYAGKGNREAFLIALEHASDTRFHGVLRGTAPKGATLRLTKRFKSPTWDSFFNDRVTSTLRSRGGRFSWVVNPSTRPVIAERSFTVAAKKPFAQQSFEGTVAPTQSTDHVFRVARRADVMRVDLDWPTPDDLDLEVLRRKADGSLESVGTSGNLPGAKERVTLRDVAPGRYVLRVVNYLSVTPSYEVTAALFEGRTRTVGGGREAYTLTCSVGGKVRSSQKVFVDRGQVRALANPCRRG